jgi:hypothetical protein
MAHLLIILGTAATTLLIAYCIQQHLKNKANSLRRKKRSCKVSFQFTNASGAWQSVSRNNTKKETYVVWSDDWDHTWQSDIQPIWAHKHENKEKENK